MHLLLPPSETKRSGGGGVLALESLAHDVELRGARMRVREELVALCGDEEAAAKALKLGVKNRDELERNLRLDASGVMPAIERYTGVLYDALDAPGLPPAARRWLGRHASVQSALFGLVAANDRIPAYRLSASSRLPGLSAPLKQVWSAAHADIDLSGRGWVLDLRSKDYAALAPLPSGRGMRLHVAQRGDGGEVRALNHFNKAAKGDLVRRLALSRPRIGSAGAFARWAEQEGLEVLEGPAEDELTLVTTLGAPLAAATR